MKVPDMEEPADDVIDEAGGRRLLLDDSCLWPDGKLGEDIDGTVELDWTADEDDLAVGSVHSIAERKYPCPAPTRWKIDARQGLVSKWVPVSSAVFAKVAPVRHTFRVQRIVTWGASVEGGYKVSIALVEADVRVKLSGSVRVSTTETVAYTVPLGQTMCLYASAGLFRTTVSRTVYGSSMCTPVVQRSVILTPVKTILKVDRC